MIEGVNMDPRQQALFTEIMQRFSQLQTWRNLFAQQWEEIAELILPTSRNTFYYQTFNFPGMKKTDRQVDASGMMALSRFAAICDSLLTPRNMFWHGLGPEVEDLKKDRETQEWFAKVVKLLFRLRYAPIANFSSQNQNHYTQLGAFGNAPMFVDQAMDPQGNPLRQLRYKEMPLGEVFLTENHQGLIDGFIRWYRLTARQAMQKFGPERFPAALQPALDSHSEYPYNFLHCVWPRTDYDPKKLDQTSMPFVSIHASIEGAVIIHEGGYHSFPAAISRYEQTPGETYGRSPAMMVLPALKTLNAEKATFLKQGHRAADPVLLTADDGLIDGVSLRPGALNKGGVSAEGKPLVTILPTGEIQVSKEMMDEERQLIGDAFLVTLFQILEETPQMTATEVIERTNEKGILLAPTIGRQQSEYLGPLIDRELDLAARMRLLPPMPPQLRKALGAYEVNYTSPLSKAMRAQEAAGFMRTLSVVQEVVQITQDPSPLDLFAFDRAIPEIAVDVQSVPITWMSTDKEIANIRKGRAQAAQQKQQLDALPNQAAMVKAQAAATVAQSKTGGMGAPGGMGSPGGPGVAGGPPPGAPPDDGNPPPGPQGPPQ